MTTVPAPTIILSQEEWADTDFDLPEGEPFHAHDAESDKDDDEDWDVQMDLGKTGGAKARAVVAGMAARSEMARKEGSRMFTIRPPLPSTDEDEEDDEGVSTIKVAALPALPKPSKEVKTPVSIDEDFEDAFVLPSDLTQLSLRPASLHHQSSKNSLEWGDHHTSSSQSSDSYSNLGLADGPSSSSASTSASQPETETDEDEEDGDLDGLVIPTGLFGSRSSGNRLAKILEKKKHEPMVAEVKVASPDPEDNFEIGLVIDDDADFSQTRLLQNTHQQHVRRPAVDYRSSCLTSKSLSVRPPSRLRSDRAKSPVNPPPSSTRQFQKLKLPPSPPPHGISTRAQTYQVPSVPAANNASFLAVKSGSLRGQKSHTGLKPPTPPSSQRKLTRKASLSSLMETSTSHASGSGSSSQVAAPAPATRYEAPTAASRAKTHTNSTSRMHGLEYNVPPTRPSTPSSNPAALRLTMPTSSSRLKTRPPISSVFPASPSTQAGPSRATSPILQRPPSSLSLRSHRSRLPVPGPSSSAPSGPKVMRKPKRQRTYGDGTELDDFDDLPTDRDKESQYRVQPKGYGNRVPGAMYPSKALEATKDWGKGTLRRKAQGLQEMSMSDSGSAAESASRTLKRTGRIEFSSAKSTGSDPAPKRKKTVGSPPGHTRRKPTLIRNLGGSAAPKVIGEMKWNPQTLRWEGNDQALRDFDVAVGTSTRPALITHLTGSSVGSPVGSFASGARRVGNMIFDPSRMCWISTLSPEEDEPDVFADLADDEEDDWEGRGGTIRANQQNATSESVSSSRVETPSPSRSHRRSPSGSDSDRGSRASMVVCDVDDTFLEACRTAEERHRSEMRGWKARSDDLFVQEDRAYLYEIRALATRKY